MMAGPIDNDRQEAWWQQPVLKRYAVTRLRPWKFFGFLVVVQVVVGFSWLISGMIYLNAMNPTGLGLQIGTEGFRRVFAEHGANACVVAWLVLLLFQGLIVMMKGTLSVATGIAREAHEGVIEAMRLTPMSLSKKVFGQLLGLPIFENLLGLSLMPYAVVGAWLGGIPMVLVVKVYLLFWTSAMFHQGLGLVAGTVIQQKVLAGAISQVFVVMLHLVLPMLGVFGIGALAHFGIEAAILDQMARLQPSMIGYGKILPESYQYQHVQFFRWAFALPGYHWMIVTSGVLAVVVVLVRRWRDAESQLFGKLGSVLVMGWILLLSCGELLPMLESGRLPGSRFASVLRVEGMGPVDVQRMAGVVGLMGFGVILSALNLWMISSIVPSALARCRKSALGRLGDGRDAFLWVGVLSIAVGGVCAWVTKAFEQGQQVMAKGLEWGWTDGLILLSVLLPALVWYQWLLRKGLRVALLTGFLLWIVPVMAAVIGMMFHVDPGTWPKWLAGVSGLLAPGYAICVWGNPLMPNHAQDVLHVHLAVYGVLAIALRVASLRQVSRRET